MLFLMIAMVPTLRQLVLGLSATVLLQGCGPAANQNPVSNTDSRADSANVLTLNIATEPTFPPFEYEGEDGKLEGFDLDLMSAIAEAGEFEVVYESLPFDGIIPALQSGTVDGAISAITITAERAQVVDFSRPYFRSGLSIAVAINNTTIETIEDLTDQKIAVQIGTTGADQAATIPGAQISTFDSTATALQELANGNVDAVINDAPVTLEAIALGNLTNVKVVGTFLTEEFYGIALPKGSEHLDTIDTALETILQDGTYDQIHQKWFGPVSGELPDTAL
jgi:arginine/lysine/histidine/glutamine transport system substrate-binding/permease protein